jgi:proteasome accessory factor B
MDAGRRPTYGAATRLARIVHGLLERPWGWSFDAIETELDISERTLLRYLAACREELTDASGNPILETFTRGSKRMVRLAEGEREDGSSAYELLFLYFALTVFRFLDGTILKEGVEGLWARLQRALPKSQQQRLANFDRKFFTVEYGVKDYRDFDDQLDDIVRCLVDQRRLRIDYAGLLGEGRVHDFDPYTLLLYRGGLYLLGFSHLSGRIIYLAIERIRSVERTEERFEYPADYSPRTHTEGVFGIVEGREAHVRLQLLNDQTAAYLRVRQIHPTQRFHKRRDGTTEMSFTVRGTAELVHWILGLGPYVRVLAPKSLRDEVQTALCAAADLYD